MNLRMTIDDLSMSQPATNSNSANARRYWRSLEELADTPEFKEWLQREFPRGASEMEADGHSRRNFLKLMSASFALAGIATLGAGCRKPEEHLEPHGQQPENYVYGEAQYFATAMPARTGAVPLVVKSSEGRPVKIEGNALFPGGNGGTDRYAQASILDLYDPDRARRFTHDHQEVSREEALKFLDELAHQFSASQGEGLAFLAESSTSPGSNPRCRAEPPDRPMARPSGVNVRSLRRSTASLPPSAPPNAWRAGGDRRPSPTPSTPATSRLAGAGRW